MAVGVLGTKWPRLARFGLSFVPLIKLYLHCRSSFSYYSSFVAGYYHGCIMLLQYVLNMDGIYQMGTESLE